MKARINWLRQFGRDEKPALVTRKTDAIGEVGTAVS